ncbi:hypothetical protein WOLCODRAFT_160170 [Wolfiporia cocos MD-104 SS10]|uniref:Uncharacterized protein n=1 Tax=Wolfiporia cocos (strain MD-104) TaxID=742152 RepID=A0A2H3IVX0_WOLCO|nr:hypothetical protein WOLCODRAFT_160170 [Wolfiporia cocos MD-104 SS10]
MAPSTPPPQTPKYPAPSSSQPNGSVNTSSTFIPRKEFIREPRVVSTFCILALSGSNLVRLYRCPEPILAALRGVFDAKGLITAIREQWAKHSFEFQLVGKPWSRSKSAESEELIIGIMTAVLQCGYSFVSSVDYGRESDDRLILVFSKPASPASPSGHPVSVSTATLPPSSRTVFAISFVSQSVLRVVHPPLHSTPAILQAARGSWPRGVVAEKKLGDSTFQFKFRGNKIFQEDTFAADSLQQILTLMATLDTHAFTLLTSLTLTRRSRKHDLWIFTGPSEGSPSFDTPHPSPGNSSLELKAEGLPYTLQSSNEKLAPVNMSYRSGNTTLVSSSPLKQSTFPAHQEQGNSSRRAPPKVQIPASSAPEADSVASSPVDNKQHPFSSSMGSVDMTGVGSGRGKGGERLSRSPDVLYMTSGVQPGHIYSHRNEHNPFAAMGQAVPPHAAYMSAHANGVRHASQPSQGYVHHALHPKSASDPTAGPSSPPVLPYPGVVSRQQNQPLSDVKSPVPMQASGQGYFQANGQPPRKGDDGTRHDRDELSQEDMPDMPHTPTPPLLTPEVFRDSGTTATHRTAYELAPGWPIAELDFGPRVSTLANIREEDEGNAAGGKSDELHGQAREQLSATAKQTSIGPAPSGAYISTPKDERRYDDVVNMFPPTIHEQPSQELADAGRSAFTSTPDTSRSARTEDRRRDRNASRATTPRTPVSPEPRVYASSPGAEGSVGNFSETTQAQSSARTGRRRSPTRRDTDTSGWVLVNIDRGDRPSPMQDRKGKSRQAQSASPGPSRRMRSSDQSASSDPSSARRPLPRMRSSSDSRLPQARGGAVSSMSPAAKAIVIIDAVGAKEKEHEKSGSGSGFRKIFGRGRDKGQSKTTQTLPETSDAPRHANRVVEGGVKTMRSMDSERLIERQLREKWKFHVPASTRSTIFSRR